MLPSSPSSPQRSPRPSIRGQGIRSHPMCGTQPEVCIVRGEKRPSEKEKKRTERKKEKRETDWLTDSLRECIRAWLSNKKSFTPRSEDYPTTHKTNILPQTLFPFQLVQRTPSHLRPILFLSLRNPFLNANFGLESSCLQGHEILPQSQDLCNDCSSGIGTLRR